MQATASNGIVCRVSDVAATGLSPGGPLGECLIVLLRTVLDHHLVQLPEGWAPGGVGNYRVEGKWVDDLWSEHKLGSRVYLQYAELIRDAKQAAEQVPTREVSRGVVACADRGPLARARRRRARALGAAPRG